MMSIGTKRKRTMWALVFLLPNLLGFLVFTAGPVVISLGMSVTDLSLTEHNSFSDEPVRFVGLENFAKILTGSEAERFWGYMGNTLYLMVGIPIGIAGSLALSLLITSKIPPERPRSKARLSMVVLAITGVAAVAVWAMTTPGAPPSADPVMSAETCLADLSQHRVAELRSYAGVLGTLGIGVIALLGVCFGSTFFRTAFYLPSLLAGVPMFLLWKALYRPDGGLINASLDPAIDAVHRMVSVTPGALWKTTAALLSVAGALACARLVATGVRKLRDREAGAASFLGRIALVASFALTVAGLAYVVWFLPERAAAAASSGAVGFDPPEWLVSREWAKLAIVIMGVWLGVGGANMLLYIAGISNIPPELYEATDIDGAGAWARFIHITWPQLAPTTFFIVIMSTIGGLQGGFEPVLLMTGGQYDTTVLTYYIYKLAFTDGFQLGLASAVAWVMFALIFAMTLINYRFGSGMTND
ncbi:MAG: sugar ABC transporter permease [Planctomycetota bacterium]